MRNINIRLLLNRTKYDIFEDLTYAMNYFKARGIVLTFVTQHVNISGYTSNLHSNTSNGFTQYILDGAKPLIESYITDTDDICILVLQGYKEFLQKCPSTSEQGYLDNGKTIFTNLNADDNFNDQVPNFRIWMMHEIMHALGKMAQKEGYPIDDCMDIMKTSTGQTLYYHLNYEPENPNSNFINMFEQFYNLGFLKYE